MIFIGTVVSAMMALVTYGAFIVVISFMAWMAVDAGKQDRFWWVVLILGVPFIGSVAYYFTEKKHEYAKAPSHHVHTSETELQHETTPKKLAHHKKSDDDSATSEPQTHEEKTEDNEKQG